MSHWQIVYQVPLQGRCSIFLLSHLLAGDKVWQLYALFHFIEVNVGVNGLKFGASVCDKKVRFLNLAIISCQAYTSEKYNKK